MIARTLAPKLQEKLGGTFIVAQQGRRRRHGRRRRGQARGARRLHDPRLVARAVRDRPAPDQEHRLRPAEGLRLHHGRRAGAERAGRAGELAAQVAGRRARVPQGQPRQDELRLGRQRHQRPPHRRAVLAGDRHQRPAHSLQGRRAGDVRPARRPGRRDLHEHQHRPAAHQGRQAARAGDHQHEALAAAARRADDGRVGPQGRDGLLVAGVRGAQGPARRHQGQAARGASSPGSTTRRSSPSCSSSASRSSATRRSSSPPSRRASSRAGRRSSRSARSPPTDARRAIAPPGAAMAEESAVAPLYISMHEGDNVAIVANDGGLPAGTRFPSGLDAGRQGAAGPQGRARRPRRRRRRCAATTSRSAARARAIPAGSWVHERLLEMPDARSLDGLPIATVKRRAAGAARGLHLRGLSQRRRLGRHAQHPGDHDHRAVRRRRRRVRGRAHQGRAAAEVPERRRRRRPRAHLRLRRRDRRAGRGDPDPHAAQHQPEPELRQRGDGGEPRLREAAARAAAAAGHASRSSTSATSPTSARPRKPGSTSSACRTRRTSASCR